MEPDKERISTYLAKKQCDILMNVPEANHMGDIWERQMRRVRSVTSSVLAQAKERLDDASLRTFLCEAMSVFNDLKTVHLITMRSGMALLPPSNFI